ncbi:hypothetical protein [Clostridium beijerinckii]|nr:hypothetical protein [Clostridium beijerinckii]
MVDALEDAYNQEYYSGGEARSEEGYCQGYQKGCKTLNKKLWIV